MNHTDVQVRPKLYRMDRLTRNEQAEEVSEQRLPSFALLFHFAELEERVGGWVEKPQEGVYALE